MLRRVLLWAIGLVLVGLLITPFALDAYHRYVFHQELSQLSNPTDRNALMKRYGSLAAVGDNLARQCEKIFGRGEPSCLRYRLALRE